MNFRYTLTLKDEISTHTHPQQLLLTIVTAYGVSYITTKGECGDHRLREEY